MVVGDEHDSLFICISIPQDVPRFLEVGSRGVRVPVETAVAQSFAFNASGHHARGSTTRG